MNAVTQKLYDQCLEMTGNDRTAAAQLVLADALQNGRKSSFLDAPLTLPEVASHLRVRREKVLHWIRSGELRGYNVAARQEGKRPKYRIDPEELRRFAERRQVTPPAPAGRPARPRQAPQFSKPVLDTASAECGRRRPGGARR